MSCRPALTRMGAAHAWPAHAGRHSWPHAHAQAYMQPHNRTTLHSLACRARVLLHVASCPLARSRPHHSHMHTTAHHCNRVHRLSMETHAVAQRKQEQMERLRKAMGLGEVGGDWGRGVQSSSVKGKRACRGGGQLHAARQPHTVAFLNTSLFPTPYAQSILALTPSPSLPRTPTPTG